MHDDEKRFKNMSTNVVFSNRHKPAFRSLPLRNLFDTLSVNQPYIKQSSHTSSRTLKINSCDLRSCIFKRLEAEIKQQCPTTKL